MLSVREVVRKNKFFRMVEVFVFTCCYHQTVKQCILMALAI